MYTFYVKAFTTKWLYGRNRVIITYDVVSPDGEVFEDSMVSLDRRWIRPKCNIGKGMSKWCKVTYNTENGMYEFADKLDPESKPYKLMNELVVMLDLMAIESELLK